MREQRPQYGPRSGVRKILHLDLDAFFCSVEEIHNPELKGKAFAVGGSPDARGVVASCSYAARAKGVRSAMPMSRALRLCPEMIIVHGTYRHYSQYSRQVMDILGESTAMIQQISVDEAFMDLSDLPQSPLELAQMLQEKVNTRLQLPCSLGAATNKLVAKIACDTGKARHRGLTAPNSILVVEPGEEEAFLAPLPVSALWGVGPKTAERLEQMGIRLVRDLTALGEAGMQQRFGDWGLELLARARGQDDRAVGGEGEMKSASAEVTYDHDTADEEVLVDTLRRQSEEVARRLRRRSLGGSTVRIKIRWPDFSTHTRQMTLGEVTNLDTPILNAALTLFHQIWKPGMKVRLLGVGVSGLEEIALRQLSLWDTQNERERRLRQALDELRDRYGEKAVLPAKRLKGKDSR